MGGLPRCLVEEFFSTMAALQMLLDEFLSLGGGAAVKQLTSHNAGARRAALVDFHFEGHPKT